MSTIPNYTAIIQEKRKKRQAKGEEKDTDAYESTREILSAPTKQGKSTLMMQLVRNKNKVPKDKDGKKVKDKRPVDVLVLCVKEPDEDITKEIQRIFKKRCIVVESVFDVPDINSFNKNFHNVIIFDDICNESDKAVKRMQEYFTRGRKRGISVLLLTQSTFGIPPRFKTNSNRQWLRPTSDEDENKRVARKYNMPASLLLYLFTLLKPYQFLGLSDDEGASINFEKVDLEQVKKSEGYETFLREYKEERKRLK